MGKIIDKIKELLGIKPKVEMLPVGNTSDYSKEDKRGTFQKNMKCEPSLTPSQEIEKVLENRIKLADENIELEGLEARDDKEKFQGIRDEGARRNKIEEDRTGKNKKYNMYFYMLLNLHWKPKVSEIIEELYESDPTILEKGRKNELVERIKQQTGIDKENPDKTFEEWVIDSLDIPVKLGMKNGIETVERPKINLRPIIESVMPLDEFVKNVIENRVNGMQAMVQNASVIGEKFGVAHALMRAINPKCTIPTELQDQYDSVEDYQEKKATGLQEITNQVIEDGTISEQLTVFRQKFIDSQLFSKNAILGYSLDEYKSMVQQMIEREEEAKDGNSKVSRLSSDLMQRYMMGLWKGAHCISENNQANTYFEKYEEKENGDARYHYYQGNIENKETISEVTK